MTQHTEIGSACVDCQRNNTGLCPRHRTKTATPKRWYFLGSTPYVKAADHDRIVAALRLELSAERAAVAQYIGERNELRGKLDAAAKFKEYVHHRLDDAGIPTHPDGAHSQHGCRVGDRMDILIGERDTIEQLAQAQNDVLEKAANAVETVHVMHGDHYAAYGAPSNDGKELARIIRSMKSPNSAEGEPG